MQRYQYWREPRVTMEDENGLLLRSDDRLKDSRVLRASLQKILLSPEEDVGLEKQFEKNQTELWTDLFRQCAGRTIMVRLPDMLFDCLLPQTDEEFACIAAMFQCAEEELRQEAERLTMRHRLCCCGAYHFDAQYLRLFELQIRSIMHGAERGGCTLFSMLLPCGGNVDEIGLLCGLVDGIAAESCVCCSLGIEIATPKAACEVQQYVGFTDFLVFDTEALTQKMYGISEGDAVDAVSYYMKNGWFEQSPFCSFDQTGLGTLLLFSIERARQKKHEIRIGLMGKPACEPVGIAFCRENKVDILCESKG